MNNNVDNGIIIKNSMNDTNIINYIKQHYPRIIFNPLKIKDSLINGAKFKSKILGFFITNAKLVIGYINKDGSICKIQEPIDLNTITSMNLSEIMKKIPMIQGSKIQELIQNDIKVKDTTYDIELKDNDKDNEKDLIINELKVRLQNIKSEYQILIDSGNVTLIKNEQDNIKLITELNEKFKKLQEEHVECKQRIINEKEYVIESIKNYKDQTLKYIKKLQLNNVNTEDEKLKLQELNTKLINDKNAIEIKLENVLNMEEDALKKLELNGETSSELLKLKSDEIIKLKDALNDITIELNDIKIEKMISDEFKTTCINKIILEKNEIVENIKDYTNKWMNWIQNNIIDIDNVKLKLNDELKLILENIKKVINFKDDFIDSLKLELKEKNLMISKLNSNISDIKYEINNSLQNQLIELNLQNEALKEELQNDKSSSSRNINEKELLITDLKNELNKLKEIINSVPQQSLQPKLIDNTQCNLVLQNFMLINNTFYRKKEIIKILDGIINNEITLNNFKNLSDNIKHNIRNQFNQTKEYIHKHIDFLDLNKYINSPNIELFKSKDTINTVPQEFCTDLFNIYNFWNTNKAIYQEQDRILTNIYEDLAGAVRIYIKIKPYTTNNKIFSIKNKYLLVDKSICEDKNQKQSYGEFYNIFDESYNNKEIYTGIHDVNNLLELKIPDVLLNGNSGLFNSFKQVEDGYSIVVFGYGQSGSAKTRTLLGEKGVPGIIHYGLANLKNVKKIKVKYIFEQYIKNFKPTLKKLRGEIINLVNEIPQLQKYSISENQQFAEHIDKFNLNNIKISDLIILFNLIESYRIKQNRIKKTPYNPVSSRSHLYIVFEIEFENKIGELPKKGYITLVDTAGRENPIDIYKLFIDTNKNHYINLTTLLGPTGGPKVIENNLKEALKELYTSDNIYNILNEGFYINETLNHLVYFFNKKNYKSKRIHEQGPLEKYSINNYYVNPREEETIINDTNNCLTIPILNFLDNLSLRKKTEVEFKPTKFICFVCIRQEEEYCNQILSSLHFAQNISST